MFLNNRLKCYKKSSKHFVSKSMLLRVRLYEGWAENEKKNRFTKRKLIWIKKVKFVVFILSHSVYEVSLKTEFYNHSKIRFTHTYTKRMCVCGGGDVFLFLSWIIKNVILYHRRNNVIIINKTNTLLIYIFFLILVGELCAVLV